MLYVFYIVSLQSNLEKSYFKNHKENTFTVLIEKRSSDKWARAVQTRVEGPLYYLAGWL